MRANPIEEVPVPGPYEGVHGFVFLHNNGEPDPATVIEQLQEHLDPDHGPVFFAMLFEGDFAGFAHFAADDLEALVDFTGSELFEAGIRSDYATEGAVHVNGAGERRGPKRRSPRYCAICRVRCEESRKPKRVLRNIVEEFNDHRPFMGAARVIGGFQLLVELGSNDWEILTTAIERLRSVDGVDEDSTQVGTTDTGEDDGEPEDSG
jgi:hypothetical protein